LHNAAFHGRQNEGGQRVKVEVRGEPPLFPRFVEALSNGLGPAAEVVGDALVRGEIFGLDFKRQAAQRTAESAPGC
jgi:hypothetical protein